MYKYVCRVTQLYHDPDYAHLAGECIHRRMAANLAGTVIFVVNNAA